MVVAVIIVVPRHAAAAATAASFGLLLLYSSCCYYVYTDIYIIWPNRRGDNRHLYAVTARAACLQVDLSCSQPQDRPDPAFKLLLWQQAALALSKREQSLNNVRKFTEVMARLRLGHGQAIAGKATPLLFLKVT